MKEQYYVCVYIVDRAYGGHEEGGWHFDYGVPLLEEFRQEGLHWEDVQSRVRCFSSQEKALDFSERLQQRLDRFINKHRRPISSVLSEGEYQSIVTNHLPAPYQKGRPRYE